jgi:two-component system catabolic regulation response regulator CreB
MLDLTRYEYLLLKALLEHPGHVLSRAQLMDRVWTDAPDTLDRTVDAHVKSLRAKLRAVDRRRSDPIQTHRGMGYSLDARMKIGLRILLGYFLVVGWQPGSC